MDKLGPATGLAACTNWISTQLRKGSLGLPCAECTEPTSAVCNSDSNTILINEWGIYCRKLIGQQYPGGPLFAYECTIDTLREKMKEENRRLPRIR